MRKCENAKMRENLGWHTSSIWLAQESNCFEVLILILIQTQFFLSDHLPYRILEAATKHPTRELAEP